MALAPTAILPLSLARRNPEEQVNRKDDPEGQHRQQRQAALQQDIERQMEDIKPDIDTEKRVGDSEGPAVTKAQVSVPFALETSRKKQSDAGADQENGGLQ